MHTVDMVGYGEYGGYEGGFVGCGCLAHTLLILLMCTHALLEGPCSKPVCVDLLSLVGPHLLLWRLPAENAAGGRLSCLLLSIVKTVCCAFLDMRDVIQPKANPGRDDGCCKCRFTILSGRNEKQVAIKLQPLCRTRESDLQDDQNPKSKEGLAPHVSFCLLTALAVLDGTDAVMLSERPSRCKGQTIEEAGAQLITLINHLLVAILFTAPGARAMHNDQITGETANGQFPELVVSTMAALCQNAEEMVDADKLYNFLRNHTPKVDTLMNRLLCAHVCLHPSRASLCDDRARKGHDFLATN
eukprot:1162035-Pelagomonas_calceolata.AAC.15